MGYRDWWVNGETGGACAECGNDIGDPGCTGCRCPDCSETYRCTDDTCTCDDCGNYRRECTCPFLPPQVTAEREWMLAEVALQHSQRVLLYGAPGTGKTWTARNTATGGREVFAVTCQEEQPVAEMRGSYMPAGPGKFKWTDGPAITAWRKGGRLVIDEIDHADPSIWSLLHAVCDDPSISGFTLPTGEEVRPTEGFQVVATMNGSPEDLPPALADRFAVRLEITSPHPGAIESLSEDLRPMAESLAVRSDERRVGLRSWLAFDALRRSGVTESDAAELALGPWHVGVLEALEVSRAD